MNAKPPRRRGKDAERGIERSALGRFFLAPWRLGVQIILFLGASSLAAPILGFHNIQPFNEQIREQVTPDHVRIVTVASQSFDSHKPTLLIIYALPNGNSIEQTIGCCEMQGRDWHYYIQHIGAQARLLRDIDTTENVVVAYVEATADKIGKSWTGWHAQHNDAAKRIHDLVDSIAGEVPTKPSIAIVAHSGGGAFIFDFLDSAQTIDDRIWRIAFLDSNYRYSDDNHHGDKLLAWLRGDPKRTLFVLAYDDRNITLDGKPVLGPTGGTWRASHRMIDRFTRDVPLTQSTFGDDFDTFAGMNGQIRFFLHRNPKNMILHTALVGEMSGFLESVTINTPMEHRWGELAGPAAYDKWISNEPLTLGTKSREVGTTNPATLASQACLNLPDRSATSSTGSEFIAHVAAMQRDERESAIMEEIRSGNVPSFLRMLVPVDVKFSGINGVPHIARYFVTSDYLSIGADGNFVRMPMLPATAQKIADLLDCSLPTRKMVDDIDAHAMLRLAPRPMTAQRESPLVFLEHNCFIEQQRCGRGFGALVCGIKKDIVITNRLQEKPHRVAIYGWRQLNGKPIQPLTIVHADTYVDYSHGVRLVWRHLLVDGQATTIDAVLKDPKLCGLLSDEGVIDKPDYR